MDWGIDPARVAEIMTIASSRRFSARDTEKFVLAVVGGAGENADMPLWDMLQVLFALGALTARPGMGPRDAAIACMLDESGLLLRPLRQGTVRGELAEAAIEASPAELGLVLPGGKSRTLSWNRVRRALGLADFLFAAEGEEGGDGGLAALRGALDIVFSAARFDEDCLKLAVQEPARFMRAWRRRHLPLLAFADMLRLREAFLNASGRRSQGRDFDPDDLISFWSFALLHGQTWSFARFVERFSALMREERAGVGRRDFLAPASVDALTGPHPSENPEEALIAWLDQQAAMAEAELDLPLDEEEDDAPEPDSEDEELRERTSHALMKLPSEPKFLNKEEREAIGRALVVLPLAHEQPLTLVRSRAVAPWENRLVEASRRAEGSNRGQVDRGAEPFDYVKIAQDLGALGRRLDELLLVGLALGAVSGPAHAQAQGEGVKLLKRLRHDRASFRMEDAKLAQIFARHERGLRTVAGALRRIVRQQERLGATTDVIAQAALDQVRFADVFEQRYRGRVQRL